MVEKEKPKIRVSETTKKRLDELGKKGESYDDIIKKRICDLDLTGQKMPFSVRIQTNSILQTVEGIVIADVGSFIWWIPKPARGCSQARHVMSKSIIEQIIFLKKDPFTLVNNVDVKFAQGQFGDQWNKDYFKVKNPKTKQEAKK